VAEAAGGGGGAGQHSRPQHTLINELKSEGVYVFKADTQQINFWTDKNKKYPKRYLDPSLASPNDVLRSRAVLELDLKK